MEPQVVTVGHSTHPIDEFLELLLSAGVTDLVDVRKLPGSNKFPHFNEENLAPSLESVGIAYVREERLGGLRASNKSVDPSVNGFWQNKSFHRYADYALSGQFMDAVEDLVALTGPGRLPALMCAEAVWWRCHRRIIADFLLVKGVPVSHLMPDGRLSEASLTAGAVVSGEGLTYPEQEAD